MAVRTRRRGYVAVAGALGVALTLAACGGDDEGGGGGEVAAGCEAYSSYGTFDGAAVNVYSSIRDVEQQRYEESFAKFEECTGIDIAWEGTGEFEAQLQVRVDGGNAPDIATVPQPGLLKTLQEKGAIKPASDKVKELATAGYPEDWLEYGTIDGTLYAPPLGANVKSFVWYSPKMFADNGWTVPTTWNELLTLSDTIAAKNIKPWCAGFESGDATGWPGTDWLEDVMLRTAGPEKYDEWVNHTVPFNDPSVVTALDEAGKILKNDKYVNGGYGDVKSIASTAFQEGGLPILDGKCALHRQASFYANQWPEGTKVGEDGDVYAFYFPGADANSKPVLGGGEFLATFNDKPETEAVQSLFLSTEWVNEKAKIGDWITSNKNLDVANVKNPVDKLSVEILQDPEAVFRFDGSDLMPAAVGAGSLWKAMVDWVTGKSTTDVLAQVEASWPKS
jgi:alpha-glucoside transport system substrate-binding protein